MRKGTMRLAKKTMAVHLVSFCVLCMGFLLCRYVFFEIHGMKDWPFYLFLFGFVVLAISLAAKASFVPVVTSFSYLFSFVIGRILQTERTDAAGGRTGNFWIIWTVVFVCAVLFSVLGETVKKKGGHKERAVK